MCDVKLWMCFMNSLSQIVCVYSHNFHIFFHQDYYLLHDDTYITAKRQRIASTFISTNIITSVQLGYVQRILLLYLKMRTRSLRCQW